VSLVCSWQNLARGVHWGTGRAIADHCFGDSVAQTGIGVLDGWLKIRESVDAPNDRKVTLYTKSKALVIGIDGYDGRCWPQLSNGVRDAEEVAKGLAAQGFEVTLKKNLKSSELEDALKYFFYHEGNDPDTRLLLWLNVCSLGRSGHAARPKRTAEFDPELPSCRYWPQMIAAATAPRLVRPFFASRTGRVWAGAAVYLWRCRAHGGSVDTSARIRPYVGYIVRTGRFRGRDGGLRSRVSRSGAHADL
jgi:hypothetical protein